MYDSIALNLSMEHTPNIDLLGEVPKYLDNLSEHYYGGDCLYRIGELGNLKVSVSRYQVKVKDGSICKWYLGNNMQSLTRKDTQFAIECLSDTLHLPMTKAKVTRLDVAQNFSVKHPVEVYLNHLGEKNHANRLVQPNSIYYQYSNGELVFYNKTKECKKKGADIPLYYQGKNILRYEQRYTAKVATQLGIAEFTGEMLYDEDMYIKLIDLWHHQYISINKINDTSINFGLMTGKADLHTLGILALIEKVGGQMQMLAQIDEAYKMGNLSRQQKSRIKATIREACKCTDGLMVRNEAMEELDKKVSNAIKYYR